MGAATQTTIKASELRIGNWILDKNGKYGQVNEIKRHPSSERDFAHIVTFQGLGKFGGYLEDLQPIRLTPEILEETTLKFTEGYDGVKGWEIAPYVWLARLEKEKWYVACEIEDNSASHSLLQISEVFYYLHQLQNLYFALTGTELPVNL